MATVTTTYEEWEARANEIRSLRARLHSLQVSERYRDALFGYLLAEQWDWVAAPIEPPVEYVVLPWP